MLSISLTQFSVDRWDCVPSLLFDLRPNYGGGNEDNGDLLQCPHLQQATTDSRLCRRLLDTHRQVWVSLLRDHCSFLLGPVVHKVLFVSSKSLLTPSWVSSGGSAVGLMATFSRRASAIPRGLMLCTQSPCPCVRPLLTHVYAGDPQTLKGSSGSVSCGRHCSFP